MVQKEVAILFVALIFNTLIKPTTGKKTCDNIDGRGGGLFDCSSHANDINASPADIPCADQAGACTDTECCTVVPDGSTNAKCSSITESSVTTLETICDTGEGYTGDLKPGSVTLDCASTTCQITDASTCCAIPSAKCSTITTTTTPNILTVCASDYTGELKDTANDLFCSSRSCGTDDKSRCCAKTAGATFKCCAIGEYQLNGVKWNKWKWN